MEDDDEKEEEEIEEENEEEEEDLNDIPLFEDNSEVIVELSNHNKPSLVPTESASAPPTSSILAQGSDLRTEVKVAALANAIEVEVIVEDDGKENLTYKMNYF